VTVVRLEENYRSTPQVLALANGLVPNLGGAEKTLRTTLEAGPEPLTRQFADLSAELEFLVARVAALYAEGVRYEEMAMLYRTNARSAELEQALAAAEIPFQGASLLERDGARQLLKALRGSADEPAVRAVRRTAAEHGLLSHLPPRVGEREEVRQRDLALLVRLAEALPAEATVAEFVAHLRARFSSGGLGGVHLLTYHRAKGLEFDAVFLPRLDDKELPSRRAKTDSAIAEERRLLYVGLTRARRHLTITWSARPSRFLRELGVERTPAVADDDPLLVSLKRWRLERAKEEGKPAFVVFHDSTLAAIAGRRPASLAELGGVSGVGPAKLERYGADVLAAVAAGVEAPAA
jgi:DNA helicase-2/ATP-dependent DNA helicase PcrA